MSTKISAVDDSIANHIRKQLKNEINQLIEITSMRTDEIVPMVMTENI